MISKPGNQYQSATSVTPATAAMGRAVSTKPPSRGIGLLAMTLGTLGTLSTLATLGLALGFSQHSQAQSWPTKPLRVIVSQTPGSAPDIIARLLSDRLSKALGQPVVVDNRPGGANVVGSQIAARAAADGSNFFFATAAALVTNPYTFKALPYDPMKDFTPVGMVGRSPFVLVAHPSVPVKTLADVVALDKAQPGKLSFASDGAKGFAGMLGEWLNLSLGSKILQVPYNVTAQGVQDTLAGRTQFTIQSIATVLPFIRRNELRVIAVSSPQRYPSLPEVPTMGETLPNFAFVGWVVMVAPTGTPAEAVQGMNRELDKVLRDPEIIKRMSDFGFYNSGAESVQATGEFIRSEYASWGKVVKAIGIEPE
jgi:tripartite-type tricarboxylate transporter receptor subunit TctC